MHPVQTEIFLSFICIGWNFFIYFTSQFIAGSSVKCVLFGAKSAVICHSERDPLVVVNLINQQRSWCSRDSIQSNYGRTQNLSDLASERVFAPRRNEFAAFPKQFPVRCWIKHRVRQSRASELIFPCADVTARISLAAGISRLIVLFSSPSHPGKRARIVFSDLSLSLASNQQGDGIISVLQFQHMMCMCGTCTSRSTVCE